MSAEFIARRRTGLSKILGIAFIAVYIFSEKRLGAVFPVLEDAMVVAGCLLVGVATVGRLWCAQYIAGYKLDRLITEGPYSVCRNPLYFFSFLGSVGVALFTESLVLTVVVVAVFAAIYPATIKREERLLLGAFGRDYERYLAAVPRFVPDPSLFHEPGEYVVNTKIFRREALDATAFAGIVGFFQLVEMLGSYGIVTPYFTLY